MMKNYRILFQNQEERQLEKLIHSVIITLIFNFYS